MPLSLPPKRSYLPRVVEFIAATIARMLYRVRAFDPAHIPAQGGVLIVANHLSYVDPVLLQLACPRPIRFMGYKGLRVHWFFDLVFRWSGAIPVSSDSATEGMRLALK